MHPPDVGQDLFILPDRGPGIHLERLDDQREQLPAADAGEGLEHGVPRRDAPGRVGPVVDPAEPLQVPGVRLGQVGQVGRDQGVVAHRRRRLPQQRVGHRGHVPVLAGQVPAEPLFGGVDVARPAGQAAGHGGQVDVAGGHQPGHHVGEEPAAPGIRKRLGNPGGERVQSPTDGLGLGRARHGSRLPPWLATPMSGGVFVPSVNPTHTG